MNNELKERVVRITRLISTAAEDAMERCNIADLTATQLHYLEVIGELDHPTLTELAAALGLTKPSVTIVVDRLVAKGFVRKQSSNTDKRSSFLYLTESGEQMNKRHDYAHESMIDMITSKLDMDETRQLIGLLDKITDTKK